MSGPLPEGAVHLLVADDGLTEGQVYRVYMALCGELVPASDLPSSLCPCECELYHPYCPACVREVARQSAEADRASEVVFHEDDSFSVHVG